MSRGRHRPTGGGLDANHHETARANEGDGVATFSAASYGVPCFDLVCFDPIAVQASYLLEVKDGSKPASRRRLTESEWRFAARWPGPLAIVCSEQERRAAVEDARRGRMRSAREAAESYRDATEPGWRQRDVLKLAGAALGGGR